MKVMIVGGGETGFTLSNLLSDEAEVILIEKNENIAKALANKANALVIKGDGTDISLLREAGIDRVDALVASTGDDTTNLMICQIAKTENVNKIIPIVHSPKNEELFSKLGIVSFVSVAGSNASAVKNLLHTYGDARVIAQLGEGDVQIIQQVISKKSKLVGKKAVMKKAVVATIYRKGKIFIPTTSTILKQGDILLVAVKTKDLSHVVEIIKGE